MTRSFHGEAPHVVLVPRTANRSFRPNGMPCNGPRYLPAAISVCFLRLRPRQVWRDRDDAVEVGIEPGNPRQIQFGELGRSDLTRLDQPGQMRHGQKRQRLVRGRPRHRWRPTNQPARPGRQHHPRRDGIEHDRRLHIVAKVGVAQRRKSRHLPAGRVESREDRLLFGTCERDARDFLRGLEHINGDGVGALRGDGEGFGHERRAQAHGGEARDKCRRFSATRGSVMSPLLEGPVRQMRRTSGQPEDTAAQPRLQDLNSRSTRARFRRCQPSAYASSHGPRSLKQAKRGILRLQKDGTLIVRV